ncbi:MAG: substrate binding domain-containing protein, partial [Shewanella sp.]
PQVIIELQLSERLVDIVGEGFDLAFRVGEPRDSSLIARHLAHNRLALLAAPSFLEQYGIPRTPEALAKLPAAGYSSHGFKIDFIKFANDDNQLDQIQMNCVYYANDIDFLLKKALSGTAYYIAPALQIAKEVANGELVPFMTDLKLLNFASIYAVYPHRDLPVRTRLFLEAVKEYIGEPTPFWEQQIAGFDQMYGFASRHEWQHLKW